MDAQITFEQKYAEAMRNMAKPTILVCGYTGVGKTSLIQAICGKDTVPDDRIGHGKPMTKDFVPYRNSFINLWDSKGFEPGIREGEFLQSCRELVARLQSDPDRRNHIHLVWYAIQGPGARVTATDVELIRKIFPNVIVVITKNDITRPAQRDAMVAELVANGVDKANIVSVSDQDHEALKNLVSLSLTLLPEAYRDAFRSAQLVDLDTKKFRAQAVVQGAAAAAAAVGAIPIPFADAMIITPVQYGMIASLAVVYGLPAEGVKAATAPLIAQVAGVMAAGSLTKLFPGMGSIIQGGVALAITETLGQLVNTWMIRCCEARIKGQALPPFQLPLERLTELVKKRTTGKESDGGPKRKLE